MIMEPVLVFLCYLSFVLVLIYYFRKKSKQRKIKDAQKMELENRKKEEALKVKKQEELKRISEDELKRKEKEEELRRILSEHEGAIKAKIEEEKKYKDEQNNRERVLVMKTEKHGNEYKIFLKRDNNSYAGVKTDIPFKVGFTMVSREMTNGLTWYSEDEYNTSYIGEFGCSFLESFGIDYLYHMTHRNNLQRILENGLHCHFYARTKKWMQQNIADSQVNDRRDKIEPIYKRNLHNYTPLYFNPSNPMLYKLKEVQHEIVILALDSSIIYWDDVVFTDGNAAAKDTKFFKKIEELEKLDWECINKQFWNDVPDGKRKRCSEVLVYPYIHSSNIKKIYCNNSDTKGLVDRSIILYPQIQSEIAQKLYF